MAGDDALAGDIRKVGGDALVGGTRKVVGSTLALGIHMATDGALVGDTSAVDTLRVRMSSLQKPPALPTQKR